MSKPAPADTAANTRTPYTNAAESPSAADIILGSLWEQRTNEQSYALLPGQKLEGDAVKEENRYGQKIDLVDLTGLPEGKSLFINDNPEVGCNPNRNKQHGFFFTADNCIGCHACESACAEKNETPAHLAFRSVGYVEGGTYPDYLRLNISMACNHCDDPVCLKGCPTGAYTKHVEYGAVLQDPETCFGCGYCTWVCPYNAPQLDPVKKEVSKCNMCVDRLEVGLKPACVSACLGNALDFGVIENTPDNRVQNKTQIPGFPDPSITQPNIRFQQTKTLPEEMTRTDSASVKYHRAEDGAYKPTIDKKQGQEKHWNLARLSSRENPLVIFTLAMQTVMGAFAMVFTGSQLGIDSLAAFQSGPFYLLLLILCMVIGGIGNLMSATHLGKPMRFYRGFYNLRHSPMAREILGVAGFMASLGLHTLFSLPGNAYVQMAYTYILGSDITALINLGICETAATVTGYLTMVFFGFGLLYMVLSYRIKARPFWNHYQVGTAFVGTCFSLGGLVAGSIMMIDLVATGAAYSEALSLIAVITLCGLALESLGHIGHARDMRGAEHEGAVSHYIQCSTFGKTYLLRNGLLAFNLCLLLALSVNGLIFNMTPAVTLAIGLTLSLGLVTTSLIGRALFYVLVVPTTMPGAFFWKNKGFEAHAKDIGLAAMPQVGIVPDGH